MSKQLLMTVMLVAFCSATAAGEALAQDAAAANPTALGAEVTTFLKTYCLRCHQGETPKGKLDLAQLQTIQSVTDESQRWDKGDSRGLRFGD